ncbi:MAG TPA: hypothetical protein VM935_00890 [Chitinophagaceae bacterium]|nr:hypothetical protein [Chitinophagaceae bacterium]
MKYCLSLATPLQSNTPVPRSAWLMKEVHEYDILYGFADKVERLRHDGYGQVGRMQVRLMPGKRESKKAHWA